MSLGWYTDISAMFENYSFSEEVMIALFHYCQERKALNKKYVHAVAESWFNGGVKTFEQLEDFLENYDNIQKIKQKITKALPTIFSSGSGPQYLESSELLRLSPITNT